MLRLRVLLLLTSLEKYCGVRLFLLTMEVFLERYLSQFGCWTFSSNNEGSFGEIFESVHWEVVCSLKHKEIRYEKTSIRRITDKLVLNTMLHHVGTLRMISIARFSVGKLLLHHYKSDLDHISDRCSSVIELYLSEI